MTRHIILTKDSLEHMVEMLSKDSKTEANVNTTGNTSLFSSYQYNDSWIIYTGSTNHMRSRLDWLSNLKFSSSKVTIQILRPLVTL